jgi:ribonuclease-3
MIDIKKLKKLEQVLGVTFADIQYLLSAMTHRSFLNENRDATQSHNERLEFLGDAVLELVVTDFLFAEYPEKQEGELTAIRAALVNTNTLSLIATALGINEYLLLSKGESKDIGRARQYILANTFESIVGAIYLDQGYTAARDFVSRQLFPLTKEIVDKRLWQDPKSRFQERAQEVTGITPSYQTLKEQGPDHDRTFTVGVFLGDQCVAQGEGRAKQEAEQKAAENGLVEKGWV